MTLTEKTPVIQKTFDYAKFSFIRSNRPVSKFKVELIKTSIEEDNQTAWRPILVNKAFGIVDGQHTFLACKGLELPVYFVQNNDATLRTMILLNAYTSNWKMLDYLTYYVDQGNTDYIVVRDFMNHWGLSLQLAMGLLSGKLHDFSGTRALFKGGAYKVTRLAEAEQYMKALQVVMPYLLKRAYWDRELHQAIQAMLKVTDPATDAPLTIEALAERLENYNKKIEPQPSKRAYLRFLEEILNTRRSKNLVRLFS